MDAKPGFFESSLRLVDHQRLGSVSTLGLEMGA